MFYIFSHTPDAGDVAATPYEITMHLASGVIHQVDVLFQDGCNHEEFVQIWQANLQLWPTNRGEYMRGNATVVSFREYYSLEPGSNILTAKVWSTLSSAWKEVIIQVGVLPSKILQPLSFEQLLAAAKGL